MFGLRNLLTLITIEGRITIQSSTSGAQQNTATSVRTEAENNLVGFQGGGEWFWSVFRGVMIGGNLKGGIYGNLAQNSSTKLTMLQTQVQTGVMQNIMTARRQAPFLERPT